MTTQYYADKEEHTVFVLGQITFVPHYKNASIYVGPGYKGEKDDRTYSANELINAGAEQKSMMLWHRPKYATTQIHQTQ